MAEKLIVLKQLPIIEQQLIKVSNDIDGKVSNAKSLFCNEETRKTIKELRTSLNKELAEWESKRKEIKERIMKPYTEFEEAYKKYISDKYKSADKELKEKIDIVENRMKEELKNTAVEYFDEYKTSKNIEFIKFEDMRYTVGLSDNPTKLKKLSTEFVDKVEKDLQVIETYENKTEILVEYKKNLNLNDAIITVQNRYKAIEEEKNKIQQKEQFKRSFMGNLEVPKDKIEFNNPTGTQIMSDRLNAPEKVESKALMTAVFKVKNETRERLLAVKKFLVDGGYDFE